MLPRHPALREMGFPPQRGASPVPEARNPPKPLAASHHCGYNEYISGKRSTHNANYRPLRAVPKRTYPFRQYLLLPSGMAQRPPEGGTGGARIEDLDTARCPRRYALQLQEDLRWLGLDWDEGPEAAGSVDLMNRAGAQLSTGRPWRDSRPRGWCTPAFVLGQSSTLPALHTGRMVRSFIPALAAA